MEKIQILFPEPQMRRLRELARREDRPISEIVRRATEAWLDRQPAERSGPEARGVPVFHGGAIRGRPGELRELAYAERLEARRTRAGKRAR